MPDFDPCGMIVDLVRSCYEVNMGFFSNRPDLQCRVRWYFADAGAVTLPFPTRFGSGNWATDKFGWTGPGEQLPRDRRWRNGANVPFYAGQFPCGTADQFFNGTTYPPAPFWRQADGTPYCCAGATCDWYLGFVGAVSGAVNLLLAGFTGPSDPTDPCWGMVGFNGLLTLFYGSNWAGPTICQFGSPLLAPYGLYWIQLDLSQWPLVLLDLLMLTGPGAATTLVLYAGVLPAPPGPPFTWPVTVTLEKVGSPTDGCNLYAPDTVTITIAPKMTYGLNPSPAPQKAGIRALVSSYP